MEDLTGRKKDALYIQAFNKWGIESQIKMCIEECGELVVALAKLDRNINGSTINHVAEEIADVEICTEQMKLILHPEMDKLVSKAKEAKLLRLEKLIDAQNKE